MNNNGNQWRKRLTTSLLCPSGNVAIVRRAGPDMALRAGKVARILKRQDDAGSDIDKQLEFLETLPDDELNRVMAFARIVLADCVIDPPLSLSPKEGQLSPDDVPLQDFWFIYTWVMTGGPTMPVKLKEGETTVAAVETFPVEQGSGDSAVEDGEVVQ